MNIIFACQYYLPFTPGGAEWSAHYQAVALGKLGHRVTVVTPNYGAPRYEDLDGVSVWRFGFPCKLRPGQASIARRWVTNPVYYTYSALQVIRAGRMLRADVIHAHHDGMLPAISLAGRVLRLPSFVTLRDTSLVCPIGATCLLEEETIPPDHGFARLNQVCATFYLQYYVQPGWLAQLAARLSFSLRWPDVMLKQAMLRRLDGVIGISHALLEIYRAARALGTVNTYVVYNLPPVIVSGSGANSSDVRVQYGAEGKRIVVCVGKYSLGKGTHVLVQAADRIAARRDDVVFLLAGKGNPPLLPERAEVRFLGSLSQREVFELYRLADLVVVPSVWPEPLGRVPLEAAVFGKPCIGSDVGGIPEVIRDGQTGVIVPRSDADALATAIVDLLNDDVRRLELGRRAQCHVREQFSEQRITAALLACYEGNPGGSL